MEPDARHRPPPPPVTTGDVIRLTATDYCYGTDILVIRVTAIGADLARFPTLEWVRLQGVEVRKSGEDGDVRDVLVRVAALTTARKTIG